MKIAVVYIYPLDGAGEWGAKADRFANTYLQYRPGFDHETVIVCNGGKFPGVEQRFSLLPNVRLLEHDNTGKDIGGYLKAAMEVPADLMIFFGSHTFFKRAEWMQPVLRSWFRKGDTLFGATSHPGQGHIHPHIRTTGFWCKPYWLLQYCPTIIGNERRYELEHGQSCMTNWFKNHSMTPWTVCWDSEHEIHQSRNIQNGYQRGDQSNIIFGDNHTG